VVYFTLPLAQVVTPGGHIRRSSRRAQPTGTKLEAEE
jgi:hypothetical protein